MTNRRDLWAYVKGLMEDRGWNQTEVVRRSGRDRTMFNRMQSGRELSHDVIRDLARAFNVPEAEFLVRMGYTPEGLHATVSADPRPLRHDELVASADASLSNDELLALLRRRLQAVEVAAVEPPADVADYEPSPAVQAGRPVPTGRHRPRLVAEQEPDGPGNDVNQDERHETDRAPVDGHSGRVDTH